jgi:daunorubicin resistance ABC transporter ATP-binding subunit
MDDFAIEVSRLSKAFGPVTALDGLTFQVPAGSVLGLLGPNGSGKTTTVSILSTALRPDGGNATVHGLDVVTDAARVRAVIGFAGQFAAVDPNLTGRENLTLIGRLSRVDRRLARGRADELLDAFGLSDAAGRLVRGYSGGMRRRLDLAAALVHRPPVLFLDEPTTGLDPGSRFRLWDAVRDLARAGTTVLLTTQYLEEADALADQVVIIADGRVAETGTPAQLKERFGSVVFTLGFAGPEDALAASRQLAMADYRTEAHEAGLQVRSDSGSGVLPRVIRALGQVHEPVSVGVHEPTLDDVFLALTGQVAASQAGGPR